MSSDDKQLTSSSFGKHFTSPKKKHDKKKTTTIVCLPGKETKHQQLIAKFKAL
jgi:hypothetical protein